MTSPDDAPPADSRTEPNRRTGVSFAKRAMPPADPSAPVATEPAPPSVPPSTPASPLAPPSTPAPITGQPERSGARFAPIAVGIAVAAAGVTVAVMVVARGNSGSRPAPVARNPPSPISSTTTVAATPATVAPATVPPSPAYWTYREPRYGFSFEIPSSYRPRAPLSPNDTAAFQSADGDVVVTVFEHPSQSADNPLREEASAKARFIGSGGRPTYVTYGASDYIVSGWTAADNVYYEFGYVGSSGEGGFTFSYPKSTKPLVDPLVTLAYGTFQPGSL